MNELPQTPAAVVTEQAPQPPAEEAEPVAFGAGDELTLIAKYPQQLQRCQEHLSAWLDAKIVEVGAELNDAQESARLAREAGLSPRTFDALANAVGRRSQFYVKLKAAVDAGYCIVPNFPVDVLAMRTRKTFPRSGWASYWSDAANCVQESEALPQGEGRYVSPEAKVCQDVEYEPKGDGTLREKKIWYPVEWKDAAFPVLAAKPKLMQAAARAVALKLFDQICISPGKRTNADPMLIGRILDPTSSKTWRGGIRLQYRAVSFMIAWFLEVRDL